MRYRGDDDDIFYYEKFINLEDIFYQIFKIEDTLEDIRKEKHAKYMSFKLMGHASQWWTNLQATQIQYRRDKIPTWHSMKRKIKSYFILLEYFQTICRKFDKCQ